MKNTRVVLDTRRAVIKLQAGDPDGGVAEPADDKAAVGAYRRKAG